MPPVRPNVSPECGDLVHRSIAVQHANGSKVYTDGNRAPRAENLSHLCRRCRSSQIPVKMGVPEESIPDGSADTPRLKPGLFELRSDRADRGGRVEADH